MICTGLPWWLSGSRLSLQCRKHIRHGFSPWVKKILRRRKWQSTAVFLLEKSHGWRRLTGYSLKGYKESDMTEWLSTAHAARCTVFVRVCVCYVASVMSDSLRLHGQCVACQAALSMAFSRQEYWSGLPCPPPGDLPDPGIESTSHLLHWQAASLPLSHHWGV